MGGRVYTVAGENRLGRSSAGSAISEVVVFSTVLNNNTHAKSSATDFLK